MFPRPVLVESAPVGNAENPIRTLPAINPTEWPAASALLRNRPSRQSL